MIDRKVAYEGEFWADKLMDLANLSIAVLVFNQFASQKIQWHVLGAGVIIYLLLAFVSWKFLNKAYESK